MPLRQHFSLIIDSLFFKVRYGGKSELATGDQGRNCFYNVNFKAIKRNRNSNCPVYTGKLQIHSFVQNL